MKEQFPDITLGNFYVISNRAISMSRQWETESFINAVSFLVCYSVVADYIRWKQKFNILIMIVYLPFTTQSTGTCESDCLITNITFDMNCLVLGPVIHMLCCNFSN